MKGLAFTMMRKKISLFVLTLVAVCLFTACSTSFSYSFDVSTGDKIEVKLDTTGGYLLRQEDGIFQASKDNVTLLSGSFLTEEGANSYFEQASTASDVQMLDQGNYQGNDYIFYLYKEEWYYIVKVAHSSTGIRLVGDSSEEAVRECFERFRFSIAE